jgi:hypothetical protein
VGNGIFAIEEYLSFSLLLWPDAVAVKNYEFNHIGTPISDEETDEG